MVQQQLDTSASETVRANAQMLLRRYDAVKSQFNIDQSFDQCLRHENNKLAELRSIYRPQLEKARFLSSRYFRENSRMIRHQEIDPRFFVKDCTEYVFISHRWESSLDPDPTGSQFATLRSRYETLDDETTGFWYDYSSVSQKNSRGERDTAEQKHFEETLKIIHLLAALSYTTILYEPGYLDRTWCCWEWLLASSISPIVIRDGVGFPFNNTMKFRHMALLVSALMLPNDFVKPFTQGDGSGSDLLAFGYLNTLLRRTLETTDASYDSDKFFLITTTMRHFWQHLRFLGLRAQFLAAVHLFERYRDVHPGLGEGLLQHFLQVSGDSHLDWTKEATVNDDMVFVAGSSVFEEPGGPAFRDAVFHNFDLLSPMGQPANGEPKMERLRPLAEWVLASGAVGKLGAKTSRMLKLTSGEMVKYQADCFSSRRWEGASLRRDRCG
jgi:hypothetical protein